MCEFKCMELADMNKHKNDKHNEVQTIKKCTICSITLLQKLEMETHLKEHDEAGKIRCKGCGKVLYLKYRLWKPAGIAIFTTTTRLTTLKLFGLYQNMRNPQNVKINYVNFNMIRKSQK